MTTTDPEAKPSTPRPWKSKLRSALTPNSPLKVGVELTAAILGIVAVWQGFFDNETSPDILVEASTPWVAEYRIDGRDEVRLLIYQSLLISNNGGRRVDLIGAGATDELGIMIISEDGQIVRDASGSPVTANFRSVFVEQTLEQFIAEGPIRVENAPASGNDLFLVDQRSIEPGQSLVIALASTFGVYPGGERLGDLLLFNPSLKFGDGTTVPIRYGFPVENLDGLDVVTYLFDESDERETQETDLDPSSEGQPTAGFSTAVCDPDTWAEEAARIIVERSLDIAWIDPDRDCLHTEYERHSSGTRPDRSDTIQPLPGIETQFTEGLLQ